MALAAPFPNVSSPQVKETDVWDSDEVVLRLAAGELASVGIVQTAFVNRADFRSIKAIVEASAFWED